MIYKRVYLLLCYVMLYYVNDKDRIIYYCTLFLIILFLLIFKKCNQLLY